MSKARYEVCGALGLLIGDVIIDEDLHGYEHIARSLAGLAFESVDPQQRRQFIRQRVERMHDRAQKGSLYLIYFVRPDGFYLQFSGERIEEIID